MHYKKREILGLLVSYKIGLFILSPSTLKCKYFILVVIQANQLCRLDECSKDGQDMEVAVDKSDA